MAIASRALRSSVSTDSGVPAVHPSMLVDNTMSAPGWGPAILSSSRTGHPVQTALPVRSPPTSCETHINVTCVSNEVGGDLTGNAVWTGWPVRELLRMAGPKTGADMVLSASSDGWTDGPP